eukprot:TRINITY_DN1452_c0_g1_i2.p1 TRINITY_DN1452_c0_g1~~TRINITY_DN1452_c0_g1_i2.p1  ORF type:complete len:275 (+),score=64.99 TRINITY_DN1452_c0_g1_i2:38-826(+)
MAKHNVTSGQTVVFVGDSSHVKSQEVEKQLRAAVGDAGQVTRADTAKGVSGDAKVDAVVSVGSKDTHTSEHLEQLIKILKPDGSITLYEPLQGRTASDSEALSRALTFAGFIEPSIGQSGEFVEVSAKKPDWEIGATQKLSLKKPAAKQWTAKADDDLIDEDALLGEEEKNSRPSTKRDDCEVTSTRKACKNCSCGRADDEAKEVRQKLTIDMIENPGVSSGCGNCALGDAFRCGGCPYRGLPTFKVGEKITIPDSFLADEI